jgi:DNA polymerase
MLDVSLKGMVMHIDFESYSRCDLIKEGAYRYASHPSTRPHILSYAPEGGRVLRWMPGDPYPFRDYTGPFYAWNAQFERLLWNRTMVRIFEWPELPIERFRCVAAMARASALPGKLENSARCMNIRNKKDQRGTFLIKKLCVPQGDGNFLWETAEGKEEADQLLPELYGYCDQDVRAEMGMAEHLRDLTPREWSQYHLSEKINDRGVRVDLDFARGAAKYVEEEKEFFGERLVDITAGEVTTARQFKRIKEWIWPRLSVPAQKMCEHYKDGEKKVSFDKAVRNNLLDAATSNVVGLHGPLMTDEAVEFTEIIDLAGNSSVSKYQTMLNREQDGVIRGLYICFGAGQTHRYSSVALQVHNFKRDIPQDVLDTIAAIKEGFKVQNPIPKLAGSLRPTIIPAKGKSAVWGDWSAIEAKALPWLANDERAQVKLDLFREGIDVYIRNAESMGFGPEQRQTGKVAELSLGYGGGIGAFHAMARGYGVRVDDRTANRIKNVWRADNPWAETFWHTLEAAATRAIKNPYEEFEAGRLSYMYTPEEINGQGALWCRLPTGSLLCYPGARLEEVETPWGELKMGITAIKGNWLPKKDETDWPRVTLWYGLLAENATQAICAEILQDGLQLCDAAGLPVDMHTHDEIKFDSRTPKRDARKLLRIMENPGDVYEGLPLTAEVEYGPRYKIKTATLKPDGWKMAA